MSKHNSPIAYMAKSGSAVFFSKSKTSASAGSSVKHSGTAAPVQKMQNALNIAPWGEDNRFPQNIEQQMAYCGVGKAGLNWKAAALFGNGIVPGRITGIKDDNSEIFTPLDRGTEKAIYNKLESSLMYRFYMEYLQDWSWYNNCFPEAVISKDGKEISHFVHQESCDSRFEQMDSEGRMNHVYLSKLWGASKDQLPVFDPKKAFRGLKLTPENPDMIPNEFIRKLDCIDMYDPAESLREIVERQMDGKGKAGYKSAIFPTNFPSVNKTYYQVPAWDGARLAGWVEIASKIPAMLKMLYEKAFRLRYHIEISEDFLPERYGQETWDLMDVAARQNAKRELLDEMDEILSGGENAYKSFITFYNIAPQSKEAYGNIKITSIEDKTNLDKDFVTQSAADEQILGAMNIDSTLLGAGKIGSGQQRSGGSDKREAYLIYCAGLTLERRLAFEPIYLMRDFNKWDEDIVFRVRDTILTTLDTGKGTEKKVS